MSLLKSVGLIQNLIPSLSKNLDSYSYRFENAIALGGFTAETTNNYLKGFCSSYNLRIW